MPKNNFTYYWGERNLRILLGNRTDKRIRALYIFEFAFTAAMATIFLTQSLPFSHNIINWVAATGASMLYLLAAYRFLARLFFSEQLLLDANYITIIRKTFLSTQVNRYEWKHIGEMHYEGKTKKTDHPLKGKSFDYFGFETHEHLIQSLHHKGNIYFDAPEGRIYFAPGIYSWDAEKLVQIMKLYSGTQLKLGPEWKDMLQEQELDDTSGTN